MKTRDAATHRRISREDAGSNRSDTCHSPEAKEARDHRKPKEVTVPPEPVEGNLASTVIWDTGL